MKTAILMLCGLLAAGPALAEETPGGETVNYCHDPEAAAGWLELLAKYPEKDWVAKLFGLRAGLCQMVDNGLISVDRATTIFEKERVQDVMDQLEKKSAQQDEHAA